MGFIGVIQSVILARTPKFLRGKNLGTFLESVGLVIDSNVQTLAEGYKLSNPLLCDPSAFPSLFKDRGLRDYTTLVEAGKRRRLSRWRQIRRHAGSHYGEMLNVQPFFLDAKGRWPLPWIRCVHVANNMSGTTTWHTLDPLGNYTRYVKDPGNWNWDGQSSKWSRWWCIIYLPPGFSSAFDWDSGPAWDSGPVWDGVSAASLADWVAALREFKAAHSRLSGVIMVDAQPSDDMGGGLGHPFDPTAAPVQDGAAGFTTLPTGHWNVDVYPNGPYIGNNTLPPWAELIMRDNG